MRSDGLPRHAVISGGSRGIGRALARLLGDAGWSLTLLARDPIRLEVMRAELAAHGVTVLVQTADVAEEAEVERAMHSAIVAHGAPRLVIAAAGRAVPHSFDTPSSEAFRRTMEVNFFGTLHLARAAVPAMQRRAPATSF